MRKRKSPFNRVRASLSIKFSSPQERARASIDRDYRRTSEDDIRHGKVYFIKTSDGTLTKIGFSIDPEQRLISLQSGSPMKLYLVAYFPGDMKEERALHRRFKAYHSHNEWFHSNEELDQLIEIKQKRKPSA